jgi:molybdopterin-guanine dinucleotide biosynthesis protein A
MRSGVVLAGGKSSRMKIDKGLILLKDKPLVLWTLERLSEIVDEIVVSVPKSPPFDLLRIIGPEITIVKDEEIGLGPIEGMLLSFKKAKGDYVAVAPCDSPFIQTSLYELLFKEAEGRDGAIPVIRGYHEPLIAVYHRKNSITALNRILTAGNFKIIEAYPFLDLKFVDEATIKTVDSNLRSFININTTEDFMKIEKSVDFT